MKRMRLGPAIQEILLGKTDAPIELIPEPDYFRGFQPMIEHEDEARIEADERAKALTQATVAELRAEAHNRGLELVSRQYQEVSSNLIRELDKIQARVAEMRAIALKAGQ